MPNKPSPLLTALSRHGFPTAPGPGLGFTADDDARFERGWPELRVLTDDPVDDPLSVAVGALDAIDPVLPLVVPRSVAAPYLVGYAVGPGPTRAEALAGPAVVDRELLERTLTAAHLRGMGDTYGRWRFPEVLYLFEGFLGPEPVARAVVAYLGRQASDVPGWGFAAQKPDRTNGAPHHVALVVPWLLRRCSSAVATELRDVLANESGGPPAFAALVRRVADPSGALDPKLRDLAGPLALAEDDGPATRAMARVGHHLVWWPARICWLLGTELLAGKLSVGGHVLPRLVQQVAPIRDPGVVRLVAHVATQRAGRAAAGAWLRDHAAYARPILDELSSLSDARERKAAAAALALLDEGPTAIARLDEDQVEAELAAIFRALGPALRAADTREAQLAVLREAYERYIEARAAGGDPTPEAYFTHRFADFGLGAWAGLAVEAVRRE